MATFSLEPHGIHVEHVLRNASPAMLYEMGIKEKEHEMYFLERIKGSRLLPLFERLFSWGTRTTKNDVDLQNPTPVSESHRYCKNYKAHGE